VRQINLTNGQVSSVNEYCKLNNIEDVDKFISKCFVNGFNTTKYGLLGDDREPNVVEKEVTIEVPVEVIKYVDREIIVEVIKEVPVPNIGKIGDEPEPNDKVKLLQETLQKLRKELSLKNTRIEDLEKINKQLESIRVEQGAVYMKGSNISETL
jgi:hypothetical protein